MRKMRLAPRMGLFLAVCCFLFTVLIGRVIDVQIFRGAEFRLRADENRFSTVAIPAERGVFLDRYGLPLVWNTRKYFELNSPAATTLAKQPISRDQALQLMASDSASVVTSLERLYRFPQTMAPVLGYTGLVSADDLAKNRSLALTDQVGKFGLELTQNRQLMGQDGTETFEVNALGKRQKKLAETPAIPGQSLTTTIDPYLSEVAYRALGQKKGSVIILDAATGEVLTLVSSPSFDPNVLTHTADTVEAEKTRRQTVQSFFTDPRQLFFNRAVAGAYPPGSVFKLVTTLAGLETGKLTKDSTVEDDGVLKVGQYEYGNWLYRQYGRTEGNIELIRAIARSNDIFFYKAAEWVGPDDLAQMARLLGFGAPTAIQLPSQASGLIPTPAWKEDNIGEKWFLGDTYHMGIGQGDVLVTPLQIAQMVQTVANTGTLCPPSLFMSDKRSCVELSLKPENVETLLEGMLDACSSGGTAFPFFPYNTLHRQPDSTVADDLARGAIACKTGTAEFGATDANNHKKTHGWFVATMQLDPSLISPNPATAEPLPDGVITDQASLPSLRQAWQTEIAQKPLPHNLVFVSMVESNDEQPFMEGSTDAAPVIKQIIDWILDQNQAPTLKAPTAPGTGE